MAVTPLEVAYPLALIVVAMDLLSREKSGSGPNRGEDRGSTMFLAGAVVAALVLVPVLSVLPWWSATGTWLGWVGLPVLVVGVAIRIWARRTLGRFYSLTLTTKSEQSVVDWGPYHRIRHPGYLGYLLMWVGVAIASLSGIVALVVLSLVGFAYVYRIRSEETMLLASMGDAYRQYRDRTRRLIPFVY